MNQRVKEVVKSGARRVGVELVPRNFYSPVPYDTPRSAWDHTTQMVGVDFDFDDQLAWLQRVARHAEGWRPPANMMYGPVDAEVLYGAMTEYDPPRVIELGSGVSSGIIREALGRPHRIFDPYVNDRTDLDVERVSAVDVPLDVFAELEAGDVLFVDTTHTVKTGGDVTRIFLEVLPRLAPGVIVHVHDIFLPHEYPYEWAEEGRLWAEQYLLHAFLIGNRDWRVLCGCNAVTQRFPGEVRTAIPRLTPGRRPGAFWMERV